MININISLVVQLINFGIIYFLLKQFLFKPLLQVMDERNQRLNSLDSGFAEERAELDRLEDEYRKRMGDSIVEATRIRTEARKECEEHQIREVEAASKKALQELNSHKEAVAAETEKLTEALRSDVTEMQSMLENRLVA